MANEFIIKNGYFSQGSSNVTGSLTVTAGVTASLQGTASWSNNAITASYIVTAQTASYVLNAVSSSFATTAQTASFVTTAQTASFVTTAQTASYVLNAVSSSFSSTAQNANTASFVTLAQTASFVTTAQTASYVLNAVSASRATSASRADSAVTASYVLNAVSASFASTASFVNTLNQNVTVSGSLTVTNDFTVLGSASIVFITSSQLNIADNIISVNTIQPGVRFGGLAVIDSGSTPLVSGSMLFDSQNNQWIFVHQSSAGAAVTSSVVLMGPQTFNNLGSETQLTTNRIPKAAGVDLGEHLNDSNITDTGVLVSINSATQITGSLTLGGGATGSLQGTASWAASASNVAPTSNAFVQGGNSFGTTALLGTNDNQNLNFETNGSVRMSISSSGQVVHGSNPLLILSGGLFEGVSPFMEVQTGVTGGAYNEAVILRHNGIAGTAVTRSLGLLIKLSSENMPNEAVKMGGMILRSTSAFSNSPDLHFVTANTEKMTISNIGNVGIGTTTPNAKLQVVGNITATSVTASLQGTASFATSASNALTASFVNPLQQEVLITGSLIVSASGGTNDFRVGTNDLFVSASGNVGIGTVAPTQGTLQVAGNVFATSFTGSITGSVTGTLTGTASFATSASFLTSNTNGFIQGGNSFGATALLGTNDTRDLSLETAGIVRLTISGSSGEVGIGQSPTTGFRVVANGTIGSFAPAGSPTGSLYIDHTGVQSWKIGVSASNTSTLSIGNDLGGAFANKPFNITNAGNVGIGTTSPNARLDVSGSATIASGLNNNSARPAVAASTLTGGEIRSYSSGLGVLADDGFLRISAGGGTNAIQKTYIDITGFSNVTDMKNNIVFGTAGVEKMRIVEAGNVGIGTIAPNARLHVSGGAETIRIETSASIGSGPYMTFYGNNTMRGYVGYGASTTNQLLLMNQASGANDSLNLGTNGLIRLTVSSSGEVGIGTSYTSPSSLLSLLAPVNSFAFDVTNAAETLFKYRIINSGSAVAPGLSFKSGLYYDNLENATVNFWRGGSTTGGFLTFNTNNGTERMRIDVNGAVGIGTTSAATAASGGSLHVRGLNTLVASTRYLKGWIGGADTWGASSFEELGIGFNGIRSIFNNTLSGWDLSFTSGDSSTFAAGTQSERMRISANGNVGIGNTTPPNTLSVSNAGATAATATTYALAVQRSNVTDITLGSDASFSYLQSWSSKPLLLNSQGNNIGINKTTTPNAVLDVNGNTIITGSLSVTSVVNGTGSFVTIDANNTLNERTAAQVRVDINYYGLTYAMQNGYY